MREYAKKKGQKRRERGKRREKEEREKGKTTNKITNWQEIH